VYKYDHIRADMMDSGMTLETQVNTIIAGLTRKKINFIAIDFDLTMSSIHSGKSEWTGTEDDIAVRRLF
jgi:hypothetical protein